MEVQDVIQVILCPLRISVTDLGKVAVAVLHAEGGRCLRCAPASSAHLLGPDLGSVSSAARCLTVVQSSKGFAGSAELYCAFGFRV
jgi:hypothetical protein